MLKGFLTDRGFQVCSDAMQVHGGAGFTEHFPASQYLRDCRIALIYEGTNGIQALDLVGRKLAADGGRGVMGFFAELDAFVAANEADANLKPFTEGLATAKAELQEATMWLMQNGLANPDNAEARPPPTTCTCSALTAPCLHVVDDGQDRTSQDRRRL